jgi:AhpC/TSA antioxidant enzyme
VAGRIDDFRRAGVDVIAISMSPPKGVAAYLAEHPSVVPILSDPDRRLYTALGLGRTTWARLLRPAVVWKYLKMILRGGKVRRVPEGEDALQLGGDFLLDRDRRILWAHRGADPTDRPAVTEILQAIGHSIEHPCPNL